MATKRRRGGALRRIVQDGWENVVSGLGVLGLDRSRGMTFVPDEALSDAALTALFRDDDLSRLVVSIYPEEALRRGWKKAPAAFDTLNVRGVVQEALTWGRLYGGCVLYVHAPGAPEAPFAGGPITKVEIFDRRYVARELPMMGGYDKSDYFQITPVDGRPFFYAHKSRCLVFGGPLTDAQTKLNNAGWDDSVLQIVYRIIRSFNAGYLSLESMLSEASTTVIKMQGLIAAMGQKAQGRLDFLRRLQLMDLTRSTHRATFLDTEGEELSKVATQFGGVAEAMDRLANRVAAATRIPVTILMGQAPAGLNATGETDLRSWYDRVESYQRNEVQPHIIRLGKMCDPAWDPESLVWPSLWQPTDTERATVRKTIAEADNLEITNQVVMPEEVRKMRYPELPEIGAAPLATAGMNVTPSDAVQTATVNEVRASQGLPPEADPAIGAMKFAEFISFLETKNAPPALPPAAP